MKKSNKHILILLICFIWLAITIVTSIILYQIKRKKIRQQPESELFNTNQPVQTNSPATIANFMQTPKKEIDTLDGVDVFDEDTSNAAIPNFTPERIDKNENNIQTINETFEENIDNSEVDNFATASPSPHQITQSLFKTDQTSYYKPTCSQIPTVEPEYKFNNQHESSVLTFGIHSNNFLTASSNLALLNDSQDFDKSAFFQTIIDMPINIKTPAHEWGKVECNFTGRINTLWGSSELSQTSSDFVKIGRAVTETKHYHEFDRPIFWVKETWLKLYSESEKTSFQIGLFPKQIGLGLILGDHYKAGNPLLTSTHKKYIDQYRPGFEFSTTFGKHDCTANFYYSSYKNNSTSFDKQIEFVQAQELCDCGDGPPFKKQIPSRPLFQLSHLITAEFDIPIEVSKSMDHTLHIKPFLMYNKDHNQTVEFAGDAESTLLTVGSTFTFKNDSFEIDLDIAGNVGSQDVKGWDRNVTEQHARMTLTHLFAKSFKNCSSSTTQSLSQLINTSGEFVLSPSFPYPPNEDISLKHEAGEEFQSQDPSLITSSLNGGCCGGSGTGQTLNLNTTYKNSFSRFRKCYKNEYRAFMAAVDMGYKFCGNKKIGAIFGYASGDDNPNDSAEKAYLYRMRSDWDTVRQDVDHTYQGFLGVHSLYTGKNVQSVQLLRAHRLNQPLSQVPELTANQFSNSAYGGIGFWYEKEYQHGTLRLNSNVIAMGLAHPVKFGFDPVLQDIYETFDFKADATTEQRFAAHNETLSQFLGIEVNAFLEFFAKNDLSFYGVFSFFFAGDYYNDIRTVSNENVGKIIPLKNQLIALSKDVSGFENAERNCITVRNSSAIVVQAGLTYNFDTGSLHNKFRPKRRKKNKVKL